MPSEFGSRYEWIVGAAGFCEGVASEGCEEVEGEVTLVTGALSVSPGLYSVVVGHVRMSGTGWEIGWRTVGFCRYPVPSCQASVPWVSDVGWHLQRGQAEFR